MSFKKLTEDENDPGYHYYNKGNNRLREEADKAKTWAELPAAYRDMVLADLGDFSASCRTRECIHLELFNGSKAKKLAREALEGLVPVKIAPEHTKPITKRVNGVWTVLDQEIRCPGSGKKTEDDWFCSDGSCARDLRKLMEKKS